MKASVLPGVAVLFTAAGLLGVLALGVGIPLGAVGAGFGVSVLAFAVRPILRRRARSAPVIDSSLKRALPEWRAGRHQALEGMVAEFAGPAATAHALRCSALVDRLAEQLVLSQEEARALALASIVHVLPGAFPEAEDTEAVGCAFGVTAITSAIAVLERVAPADVVRVAGEANERWDGSGRPGRLVGEGISMGGRILAAACQFDHESSAGLEAALNKVRRESGTAFDPVVAAELIHLFREPWQKQVAA
ncbi:MAG: HD-GYP domain-containing protein [Dehalococcoidia bacterium]